MYLQTAVDFRVSIHASTREATPFVICPFLKFNRFNPRLHAGGDKREFALRGCRTGFNPRLHAGGDLLFAVNDTTREGFNPRLHAGGDSTGQGIARDYEVSIHASTREATVVVFEKRILAVVSIHASTREATARFGIRMPDHPHILPLFYPDFFLSSLFNSKFTLISREPQPVSMLTSGSHL